MTSLLEALGHYNAINGGLVFGSSNLAAIKAVQELQRFHDEMHQVRTEQELVEIVIREFSLYGFLNKPSTSPAQDEPCLEDEGRVLADDDADDS